MTIEGQAMNDLELITAIEADADNPEGAAVLLTKEHGRRLCALARRGMKIDEAAAFDRADFYWRTWDPEHTGDTPDEALRRGGVGNYTVCEVASSHAGPVRYGFTAPVLDPESDDEEFLHFATQAEAMVAAGERLAAVEKLKPSHAEEDGE